MTRQAHIRRIALLSLAAFLPLASSGGTAATPTSTTDEPITTSPAASIPPAAFSPAQGANIGVNGFFATDKAQQGRALQAAIVLDIPQGFHVNANRVTSKFSVPTVVKVEAPKGVRVGPVSYPRGKMQRLSFSNETLALYEGRPVMRFTVSVPAGYKDGLMELRAQVRYQSCNNEVCYPPTSREVKLGIAVVGPTERVRRINQQFFGGRRG